MTKNPFIPVNLISAAITPTAEDPIKKGDKPVNAAAIPPKSKAIPPKKSPVTLSVSTGFPAPGDPYWKTHPLITEHADGTIRQWGEDTTVDKNPNILPKQMVPPVVIPQYKPKLDLSDKAKGYDNYYYRKNY